MESIVPLIIVAVVIAAIAFVLMYRDRRTPEHLQNQLSAEPQSIVVKTYKGSEADASAKFQEDAPQMASQGYFPTSQSYAPGNYGCGAFLGALILCLVLIGIVIFIYMLLVKPAGVLTVTYEYRAQSLASTSQSADKICPRCAEHVKAAAKVCRYCGHEFL